MSYAIPLDATIRTRVRLRAELRIDDIIARKACLVCSPSAPLPQHWQRPEDYREYGVSGCCLQCRERYLMTGFDDCTMLSPTGKAFAQLWGQLCACKDSLVVRNKNIGITLACFAFGTMNAAPETIYVQTDELPTQPQHVSP